MNKRPRCNSSGQTFVCTRVNIFERPRLHNRRLGVYRVSSQVCGMSEMGFLKVISWMALEVVS